MILRDVRDRSQFQVLYAEHNLVEIREKIHFLIDKMRITGSWSSEQFTSEEELSTLEQYALYCWDRKD